MEHQSKWDLVITPSTKWYQVNLQAILRYKDLLFLFVRRDFVAQYKQTILGPIWFFIQPLITTVIFTLVFGNLAGISTDGVPRILFYLAGISLWNYFSDTLTKTADTFVANASIFGKVYFPRMIVPLSVVISNLIKFTLQFGLFIAVWIYYLVSDSQVQPTWALMLVPLLIGLMGLLGLALGIITTSLTVKYRDLKFLIVFGVQLLMYASPVVYPLSIIPEKHRWIMLANPICPIIEGFRYAFLGVGHIDLVSFSCSVVSIFILLALGLVLFNRVEKSFMDTV